MTMTKKFTAVAGGVLLAGGLYAQVTGSSGTASQGTSGGEAQTSSGQSTGRTTPGVGTSQSTSGTHGGHSASTDTSRSAADKSGNMPALKSFAMKAADGGMAEVEMGKLGAQKASNDRVKQFA